jgi:hypothetical protein
VQCILALGRKVNKSILERIKDRFIF